MIECYYIYSWTLFLLLINSNRKQIFQILLTYKYTDTIMYNGCEGKYAVAS